MVAVGHFNVPDVSWRASAGRAEPVLERRSRRADELLDGCHLAGLRQHVQQPSRGRNFLDLVLSNGQDVVAVVREGVFPSDHAEVTCEVRAVLCPLPVVSRTTALNYKRADWEGLRAGLRVAPWNMMDGLPLDDATARFYDLLNAAIQDHIPVIQIRGRQPPWFDVDLRRALKQKESSHRAMKRNRTAETQAASSEKRRELKRMSSARFYGYLKGLVDDLKTNSKRFWTYLKCTKGKQCEMPYIVDGDRKVVDDGEKADVLTIKSCVR